MMIKLTVYNARYMIDKYKFEVKWLQNQKYQNWTFTVREIGKSDNRKAQNVRNGANIIPPLPHSLITQPITNIILQPAIYNHMKVYLVQGHQSTKLMDPHVGLIIPIQRVSIRILDSPITTSTTSHKCLIIGPREYIMKSTWYNQNMIITIIVRDMNGKLQNMTSL